VVFPDAGDVSIGCSVILRKPIDRCNDGYDAGIERQGMHVASENGYFEDSALVRPKLAFVYRLVC
jgi:hypothetical protein